MLSENHPEAGPRFLSATAASTVCEPWQDSSNSPRQMFYAVFATPHRDLEVWSPYEIQDSVRCYLRQATQLHPIKPSIESRQYLSLRSTYGLVMFTAASNSRPFSPLIRCHRQFKNCKILNMHRCWCAGLYPIWILQNSSSDHHPKLASM